MVSAGHVTPVSLLQHSAWRGEVSKHCIGVGKGNSRALNSWLTFYATGPIGDYEIEKQQLYIL